MNQHFREYAEQCLRKEIQRFLRVCILKYDLVDVIQRPVDRKYLKVLRRIRVNVSGNDANITWEGRWTSFILRRTKVSVYYTEHFRFFEDEWRFVDDEATPAPWVGPIIKKEQLARRFQNSLIEATETLVGTDGGDE